MHVYRCIASSQIVNLFVYIYLMYPKPIPAFYNLYIYIYITYLPTHLESLCENGHEGLSALSEDREVVHAHYCGREEDGGGIHEMNIYVHVFRKGSVSKGPLGCPQIYIL